MMPVDFVFYRNEYGGALIPDAASFKRMIRKADGYLKEAEENKKLLNIVKQA